MANSAGVSVQCKLDALTALLPAGITTLKAALYLASASVGPTTTAYTATGEVSGAGYTAGGVAVTAANAPSSSGSTAYWQPSASIAFPGVTLGTAFDALMIYDTARSNKTIGVWTFAPQTVTGDLTFTLPANDASNALLRA